MPRLSNGIDPSKLDQEITDLGVRVRLYKSTLCPNMKSLESLDHDINCAVCNHNMIDFCPKETIAIFQQQTLAEQFKVQGTFYIDEIQVTFLSGETLQPFARVELLDFSEDFYELIQRQVATDIDRLKYPACSVLAIFVVRGNLKIEYHFGTDFITDVNGDIKWIAVHRPDDKEIYTIYYKFKPVFRAIKAVHRDRYSQFNLRPNEIKSPKVTVGDHTYVKLPECWILKRDYLIERRDMAQALLPPNTLYDPNA